ncbi:hypothetical protein SAMN05880566_102231 [Janthinobacterium sp. TND4EL3]|jgi:hypothetical protein|uniref:hypothetical protein n=1 Tax=Janthinobacterium sp. TND4EL3 TaxID=1907311 RepID=UPI000955F5CA|nr:hypothetical protein [Janthinobacterium sp. TND4EL3]SIQ22107.1 hypothetical protein SAMN05880566_102231 [Janthinobacterium sp. TND4EL3]
MSVAWVGAGIAAVGVASNISSANKAAKAQTSAANQANDTQWAMYNQSRDDNKPFYDAGVTALNKLAAMPNFTGADLQNEPGYQFGLTEGMKGVTNSAAARGGLLSGAALKAASQYNNDYASTKYGEAFNRDATERNRLASIAGIGQTASNVNTSSGLNTASGVAQNQLAAGNARASGYVAGGNALTNGLSQGLNWYNQNSLLNGSRSSGVSEGATNQTDNFNYYGTGYSP